MSVCIYLYVGVCICAVCVCEFKQRVCDVGSVIRVCVYGLNCGGEIGDYCCDWVQF